MSSAQSIPDPISLIGQVVMGYEIKREIGAGGMGVVYEAIHIHIGQRAAIKVLNPALARDEAWLRRFLVEARLAVRVTHPGLVKIFHLGQFPDGRPYLLMELLEGMSLKDTLIGERPSVHQAVRLAGQMASALSALHEQGIIHRDLKPGNVFLTPDPDIEGGQRIKVLDFGLAKIIADVCQTLDDSNAPEWEESERLFIQCTLPYASPEQCTMAVLDARTDVYSLGITLYEMLCGRRPFLGPPFALIAQHTQTPPPPLAQAGPGLPAALCQLVHDMLRKQPSARPSMQQVHAALTKIGAALSRPLGRRPMIWPWLAGLLVGTIVAVAVFWRPQGQITQPAPPPIVAPDPAPKIQRPAPPPIQPPPEPPPARTPALPGAQKKQRPQRAHIPETKPRPDERPRPDETPRMEWHELDQKNRDRMVDM